MYIIGTLRARRTGSATTARQSMPRAARSRAIAGENISSRSNASGTFNRHVPAASCQPDYDGGRDVFHRDVAVGRHVDVTAKPIDKLVRLDRVSTSDDKWQTVANFQNVLHQSAMQDVEVHGALGWPLHSSGKADS